MTTISVSSALLIPTAKSMRLKPSQVVIIWEVASAIDELRCMKRYKAGERFDNGVWVEIPAQNMRPPEGRKDNHHLKKMLKELMGLTLEGEHLGDPWGAVLIAEYEFLQGGTIVRMHVTRSGVHAICAPQTFAKIEIEAKYRMKGATKLLYAALADMKNQQIKKWEEYDLDELRRICGVPDKYPVWDDFKKKILRPAVDEINDFGTVVVTMKPIKRSRSVVKVRFDWAWKDVREAVKTDRENQRPKGERGKVQVANDAPPLTDEAKESAHDLSRLSMQAYMSANGIDYSDWQRSPDGGGSYSEFLTWVKSRMKEDGVTPLHLVQ